VHCPVSLSTVPCPESTVNGQRTSSSSSLCQFFEGPLTRANRERGHPRGGQRGVDSRRVRDMRTCFWAIPTDALLGPAGVPARPGASSENASILEKNILGRPPRECYTVVRLEWQVSRHRVVSRTSSTG